MKSALFAALKPEAGKVAPESKDEGAAEPEAGKGEDYKQLAKDAAKDGDWDAMVEALCSYTK